jgi:hypothetical protein
VKQSALILLFLACTLAGVTQDSSFTLLRTYRTDIAQAVLDPLENLYIISSGGQISKFSSKGDSMGLYNQVRQSGFLHTIDVSNPLRPLLFYKDFSTVVLLDRFLSVRSTLDLRRLNVLQPSAAAISYDNNIWVFDELENKLKKFDEQGTLLMESADFRQAFSESIRPQKIMDDNGFVYLADSSKGIFVFDIYGAFKRKIPVRNWTAISVKDAFLFYIFNNRIIAYNTATFAERAVPISLSTPHMNYFLSPRKVLFFTKDTLQLYDYRF